MTTATMEIYRTESGSVYEVVGGRIRRVSQDDTAVVIDQWQDYTAINRLPAALFTPGTTGEVLEVLLTSGRRIYTSPLVRPFETG